MKSQPRFNTKKVTIAIVVLLFVAFASFYAGIYWIEGSAPLSLRGADVPNLFYDNAGVTGNDNHPEFDDKLFWQVWNAIESRYVEHDALDRKKMFYGALKGLAQSTGDPYTVFLDPDENKSFHSDVAGKFEGIGAEIGLKDEIITIVSPLEGMPAEKAGLKAGDKILEINGTSTIGMNVNEAVKLIRGPKGTKVNLKIGRNGMKNSFEVSIARGIITIQSVKLEFKDDVAVIKVTNFNETTENEFNEAIAKVVAKKPSGIMLDLRNNPGGLLNTAISMSGRWIGQQLAVIEKSSQGRERQHKPSNTASLKNYKTVILVNAGSASASEIIAGALQDYQAGVVVGMKTYGKGSVQSLEDMPDGSSLKITTALWLTPKGRSINKEGIKPDLEIDLSEADFKAERDPQMSKALEVLKNYDKYLKGK